MIRLSVSLKTAFAIVSLGGYGVWSQVEGYDAGAVVFGSLLLTILLQLHKILFLYSPIINRLVPERNGLYAGQAVAFAFSIAVALSLALAIAHRHLLAELVVALQQCLMLSVLVVIWFKDATIREEVLPLFANEIMHVLVIVWMIFITSCESWKGSRAVELALVVTVVIASGHYVVHLFSADIRQAAAKP